MTPAEALATAMIREDVDAPGLAPTDLLLGDYGRMAGRTLAMLPDGWALVSVDDVAARVTDPAALGAATQRQAARRLLGLDR